jgi:hypothetical protein
LLAVGLLALPGTGAARTLAVESALPPLTIDDHLVGHLHYPAIEQAEEFVASQEGVRRPRVKANATWGYKGCKAPGQLEVGAEKSFWVYNYDLGQNTEITAVLAAKTPHGYLWVQREYYVPADQALPDAGFVTTAEAEDALADWESIYDIDRAYFGEEPNSQSPASNLAPGLPKGWRDADCDPRISILNFPIDTPVAGIPPSPGLSYVAGYYSSEHEYPNGDGEGQSPTSNQAEMFFMNSQQLDVGSDQYAGVIAHEFYHMIQFSNDFNEATWVNEGMADVAIEVNGFADEVQGHIDAFQDEPDDHLLDWGGGLADYGEAFLFFHYLFTHYGAPENESTDKLEAYELAELLTRTAPDSTKGISKVLKARPGSVTKQLQPYFRKGNFTKVFRDYLVANYLDNSDLSQGEFGYAARDVHVKSDGERATVPEPANAPAEIESTVHPYAGDYYEFAPNTEGTLAATVADPVAVIPATEGQPEPSGGYFAWSNRADEMLTYLQRKADLTKAAAPQLSWKYWYQIEEDWDYAYVRVSTDGGKTWDFQNTSECGGRATNPNGNNRAITESGGITGDSMGWQECTLDLAAYAGKKALVRFEYDTDQATTEAGYVVDDVQLVDGGKKVWPLTNFEKKKTPFKFGGDGIMKWFRIKPLAKNKPLLQIVRISGDTVQRQVLTRKKFEKSGDGLALKAPAPVSGDRAIVVFSAITPIATDPFTYTYQLQ